MKTTIIPFLLGIMLIWATSCERIDASPAEETSILSNKPALTTFDKDIKAIFLTKCTPCHMSNGDRVNKWDNYVTVKTYITGIMGRVTRDLTDPLLMPKNGPKLTEKELASLQKWIDDGLLEK